MSFWSKRKKVPTVLQMEATECGAASLAMVLGYFGRFEPLEKLRSDCGVSRNGSKASLILKAARSYNLEAKGFQAPMDSLEDLGSPLILFWEFNHFVVYEGQSRNGKYFYINDPAVGSRVIERELFELSYTGVALSFKKTPEFKKKGKPTSVIGAMIPMVKSMKPIISAVVWGGLLLVIPAMTIPTLMRVFVDEVLAGKVEFLVPVLLIFALAVLLEVGLTFLVKLALRRGQLQLGVNKTLEMLNYLFRLPMDFFSQRSVGDVQNRLGLNSSVANSAFGVFADNIVKLFTAVFFLVLMLQFSIVLSIVAISFVLIETLFFIFIAKLREVLNQSLLMLNTKMQSSLLSGISMMESMRAAGREDSMFLQWSEQLAQLNNKNTRFQSFSIFFNIMPTFLSGLGSVLILSVGAYEIIRGELTLGAMFAFQTLMGSFTAPFSALISSSSELQTMKADVDRINDVYKYEKESIFKEEDGKPNEVIHSVTFEMKNISFGYSRQSEPIIEDFSLKVEPAKRIALVGSSASGKTTIAKIANGTLKAWSGEILLNGKKIEEYKRAEFYSAVATVDQSIMLFSGSIAENLTLFSQKYDMKELQGAIKDASIQEELSLRGTMTDLPVKEGGTNFSGGQRQRLEIARALTYHAPLLILDEATSALDPITEQNIDRAIRRRGCACIIVAHRLSTIKDCDEIIMLERGKIIERGTHEELMEKAGAYYQLMKSEES